MAEITLGRAQIRILGIFLAFFVLNAGVIIVETWRIEIKVDEAALLIVSILKMYSVHLAVILGCIFSQQNSRDAPFDGALFTVAQVLAFLWNILIFWRVFYFAVASQDEVKELSQYLSTVPDSASFIVAGMLAYVFKKE